MFASMYTRRNLRLVVVALILAWALWQRYGSATHSAPAPKVIHHAVTEPRVLVRGGVRLRECDLPATSVPFPPVAAYCATVDVPENRAEPHGRQVHLNVAIVPSSAEHPARDAVTFLDGGPGGAAVADYPLVAHQFAPLLKTRDVVLIDQRGTGHSNGFECSPGKEPSTEARVRACAVEVARQADPRHYATDDATADIEDVRRRLGYPQLTVIGVSYGTRVAQVYARHYPAAVRALVLDSPVPNALTLGQEHARNLENTLQTRFKACVADSACKARFGDPYTTLQTLLQRLDGHPIDVTITDPVTHGSRREHLTRAGLASLVRFYAYSPITTALLPLTLDEAKAGHYDPLLGQLLLVQSDLSTRLDGPMELSVLCTEDAPLLRVQADDADTVLGTGFVLEAQTACANWPHRSMPGGFHDPLTGPVPTLLLSGEWDPVTPPRYAEEIARHLQHARVLTLPGQGHSVMGIGCAADVVARFVEHLDFEHLDAECLARERATPFFVGYAGATP